MKIIANRHDQYNKMCEHVNGYINEALIFKIKTTTLGLSMEFWCRIFFAFVIICVLRNWNELNDLPTLGSLLKNDFRFDFYCINCEYKTNG